MLATGFLVSSVPRLKERGLGWAPSSTTAPVVKVRSNGRQTSLLAFDGEDSDAGRIGKDGFRAHWFMYDFTGYCIGAKTLSSHLDIDMEPEDNSCRANLQEIRRRFLRGYLWGALLRPSSAGAHGPVLDRGDSNRTLVVVCATNGRYRFPLQKDDEIYWRWRGIYEWDMAEPLPNFVRILDILLV